jgi:hypothetical protein
MYVATLDELPNTNQPRSVRKSHYHTLTTAKTAVCGRQIKGRVVVDLLLLKSISPLCIDYHELMLRL